ncbi:MAG: T9SS type A sorting domain-containing protein [Candidatus Zixiibacteriota bacterium]|nr:MAG: T9SS type A sorting domain-containing protein [candidate division Zixibacteria bacterium]
MNIKISLLIIMMPAILFGQVNGWHTNGPYNARIQAIAVDPLDDQHIFIGTVEYGVYQSINGGADWTHVDSDLLPETIRVIAIHPTGTDTMFASTTQGLYRSWDGAENWERIIFPAGWQWEITGLLIHPTFPNIVFAAGPPLTSINYISMNGGRTWEESNLTDYAAVKYVVDPSNDSAIYATSHNCSTHRSLNRSIDLGESWVNIHNNLDTTMVVYDLAVDPLNSQIMYICGTDGTNTGRCVFKSTNGGDSWFNITPDFLNRYWVYCVYVSASDHNTVYVATSANGVIRSTDGGQTWAEVNQGLVGRKEKIIISKNNVLYLGTFYNGIYRSLNAGDTWEKISQNISNTYCTDYTVNRLNPARQFVSTMDGIYKTVDFAETWEFVDLLYPDYNRTIYCLGYDPDSLNAIFVCVNPQYDPYSEIGVMRSLDGGLTWETFEIDLPFNNAFTRILFSNNTIDTRILLSSTAGLYMSDNYGVNWHLNPNLPIDVYWDAALSPANEDYAYIGGETLFRTSDRGDTWEQVSLPTNEFYITEITCHPADPDIVYICILFHGLYKSTDRGDSWVDINNNLPRGTFYHVSGLAFNEYNTDNLFVNSHHYGVYQSHDGGNNWEPFIESLNTLYSSAHLFVDPIDTNRVFLATDQQSAWSITRSSTSINEDESQFPKEFSLYKSYPNPFNSSTTIEFALPGAGQVSLTIYDILGRQVMRPVSGHKEAGNHSITVDMDDAGSGVYFYTLSTEKTKISRAMLLLK